MGGSCLAPSWELLRLQCLSAGWSGECLGGSCLLLSWELLPLMCLHARLLGRFRVVLGVVQRLVLACWWLLRRSARLEL